MALVNRTFMLDITPGAIPRVVNVSEYDQNRQYTVTLVDDGGVFEIPSGTTATIEGTLAGHPFSVEATVSGNTVTFSLDESMTAYDGDAWTKIKLTKDSKPIQTCAFILRNDRAGAEAEAVIGASGFEEQIRDAVDNWLDLHPPSSGGLTDDVKTALLDCFENVAWINDQGQTYYDALYAALYPPVDVLSISAVFTQGEAVIYDTDSFDTLRQYLVVTATLTDSTTRTVTNYTLSGTLTVGTSTITVSYGGKTTTFNVTVTEHDAIPAEYQKVEYVGNTNSAYVDLPAFAFGTGTKFRAAIYKSSSPSSSQALVCGGTGQGVTMFDIGFNSSNKFFAYSPSSSAAVTDSRIYNNWIDVEVTFSEISPKKQVKITVNGETLTGENNDTPNFGNAANVRMFQTKSGGEKCTCRVKSFEIVGVCSLVPCYRISDTKIGFYDTTNQAFYATSGTGAEKGSDI